MFSRRRGYLQSALPCSPYTLGATNAVQQLHECWGVSGSLGTFTASETFSSSAVLPGGPDVDSVTAPGEVSMDGKSMMFVPSNTSMRPLIPLAHIIKPLCIICKACRRSTLLRVPCLADYFLASPVGSPSSSQLSSPVSALSAKELYRETMNYILFPGSVPGSRNGISTDPVPAREGQGTCIECTSGSTEGPGASTAVATHLACLGGNEALCGGIISFSSIPGMAWLSLQSTQLSKQFTPRHFVNVQILPKLLSFLWSKFTNSLACNDGIPSKQLSVV